MIWMASGEGVELWITSLNSHSPKKKAESSLTLPPAILENRTRLSSELRPESDETNYTTRIYFLST